MLNFSRWKIILISLICLWGVLTSIPNLLSDRMLQRYPSFLPTSTVTLGLDLQGGIDMLISVDVEGAIATRIQGLRDQTRLAMRGTEPSTRYTALRVVAGENVDEVRFRITNEDQYDAALEALQDLVQPILGGVSFVPTNNFEIVDQGDRNMVIRFTDQGLLAEGVNIVNQTINILRQRIDELGTLDPSLQRQGADRIRIQIPGLQDRSVILDIIKRQAVMTFQMVDHSVTQQDIASGRLPPGTRMYPSSDGVQVPLETRIRLTGENLKDANATFDGQTGMPAVSFRLDGQGARIFGQITSTNVGKQFAILLDGEIISYPVINSPILGGSGQISGGSMTTEEAATLAILLRAGAAPAKVEIEEERTVGPDMGSDSVAAGKFAALIGMALVLVFIILSYGLFGLAANLALMFNIAILFGALSLLGATLTLPGIAGIVLTIGMAVDANVLVFERIREELRLGRGPFNAVETGYRTALGTILDANITTLIAAVILFQFGTGPIRGFAITLMIGIITSVFTAVTLTRLFVSLYLHKRRPKTITV